MSKRTASTSATDLIQQLRPLRGDPVKLQEALASFDSSLVGDAFAQLLTATAPDKETVEKRQKMARSRPLLANETFEDVAFFLDRDTLDSTQLACHFMRDFVCERETEKLALRLRRRIQIENGVRLEMVEDNVLKEEAFDETFFIHLAQNGVRSFGSYRLSYSTELYIEASVVIDIKAALAFGFAEPNAGGDRCLTVAVSVKSEIFTEVRRRASELIVHKKIDFKFKICNLCEWLDPAGFVKYQKSERTWLFDDLPNKVAVEIEETTDFVQIHAYSLV